jgi:hypothetical protein
MSDESPAVILYDASGNPIGVSGNKLHAIVEQGVAAGLAGAWPAKITDGVYLAGVDAAGALQVAGKSAVGAAPTSNPVAVSGIDFGGLKRHLRTDTLGRLVVTGDNPSSFTLEVSYDQVFNAAAAGWYEGVDYMVPVGYKFNVGFFSGMSFDNRMTARVAKYIMGGEWNVGTLVFTPGGSYVAPQFAGFLEAEVTTVIGGGNDLTFNITYVNQDGVGGRTATLSVPKNSAVTRKFKAALQTGDYGIRQVTAVAQTGTNTGVIRFNLGTTFAELRCTAADTPYNLIPAKDTMIARAGEILALDYYVNGGSNGQHTVRASGVLEPV